VDADRIRVVLERDPRIAYALLFGSTARGLPHAASDVDIADHGALAHRKARAILDYLDFRPLEAIAIRGALAAAARGR
jgi:predicted nucleotidyltransferase